MTADLRFWFDPVCPFAWMTSTWVREVARQRDYAVEWRFISLRLLNAHVDYASHFPPEYEASHSAGLHLLRVCARARTEHGQPAVAALYSALGDQLWEQPQPAPAAQRLREVASAALEAAGLPATLAEALDDTSHDALVQQETDEALSLTGRDVGTPILQFRPPEGLAFFGPVISRRPSPDDAVRLWDHVIGLASFGGFAELKRSLREQPQLPGFGVPAGEAGRTEDWHAGSRRLKR